MYTGRRGVSPHARVARPPRCASTSNLGPCPWPLRACRIAPIEVRLQLVCRIAPIGSSPIGLPHRPDWFETPIVIASLMALYPRLVCRPPPNPSAPNGTRRPEVCVSEIKEKGQSQIACFSKLVHDSTSLLAHVPMVGERRE